MEHDRPKLDIAEPWRDPADLYAQIPWFGVQPRDTRDARVTLAAPTIAIVGGTVLTAAGQRFDPGTVILAKGSIQYAGDSSVAIPDDAQVIDAKGRFVTPGLIDSHSHIGVYAQPEVTAHSDGNEIGAPVTAQARAEYGYFPQDPAIPRALAGGVTAALVLPGSANLVGGHGFTVVMRPGRFAQEVAFPGAPPTVKMACGENPKRVYGDKGLATRMGVYAAFRDAFREAAEYAAGHAAYALERELWLKKRARAAELDAELANANQEPHRRIEVEPAPTPPARDLKLDTLAAVLRGQVLVQVHCYRADEIREMVAIADEFGFQIRSFHHALEAYKVRDILVSKGISISTWADWWGFKMEAFDGIPENAALFSESGGRPVIHSDSPVGIQRLNQEAAKAMHAGHHAGIEISEDEALRWVTANPAWALGLDAVTGTLEPGKRADVVVWSHHPFSVYAKADVVLQGGEVAYQRSQGRPLTDFELGNSSPPAPHTTMPERGIIQ